MKQLEKQFQVNENHNNIQLLKSQISLIDYISKFVHLKKQTASRYIGLCPFHVEKTPSFTCDDQKQIFYCFGCHVKGDVLNFYQLINNCTFFEALEQLSKQYGIDLQKRKLNNKIDKQIQNTLEQFIQAAQNNLNYNFKALEYLQQRGLTIETIKHYRIGWVDAQMLNNFTDQQVNRELGVNFQLSNRILFPVFKPFEGSKTSITQSVHKTKPIGFGARILTSQLPKYINSKDSDLFHKREILYCDPAKGLKSGIILVEGYLDAIIVNQSTNLTAAASLGTAVSKEQLNMILHLEPILCFDGDIAGSNACFKLIELCLEHMQPGHIIRIANLPKGMDPASLILCDKQRFLHIIEQAVNISEYLFAHVMRNAHQSPEVLAASKKRLVDYLRKIKNPHMQNNFKTHWKQLLMTFHKTPFYLPKAKTLKVFDNGRRYMYLNILAVLLQHPYIIPYVNENLADLVFPVDLQSIQIDLLAGHKPKGVVVEYCMQLEINTQNPLKYWQELYKSLIKFEQLQQLKILQQELKQNFSIDIWNKIKHLHALIKED